MGKKEEFQKKMEAELAKCETRLAVAKGKKGAEELLKEIQGLEEELNACKFEIKAVEQTAEEDVVKRFEAFRDRLDRLTFRL